MIKQYTLKGEFAGTDACITIKRELEQYQGIEAVTARLNDEKTEMYLTVEYTSVAVGDFGGSARYILDRRLGIKCVFAEVVH
jgi:DUF1009 family protein